MYPLVGPAQERRVVCDARVDAVRNEVWLESAQRYASIFREIGPEKAQVPLLMQSLPPDSPTQMVQTSKSMTAREVCKKSPGSQKAMMGRCMLVHRLLYQDCRTSWQGSRQTPLCQEARPRTGV